MATLFTSRGSYPTIGPNISATSSTVRAMGPQVSSVATDGMIPVFGTRPSVGFKPTRLHHAAGRRTEPPESVTSAAKHIRAATAAAEPLEEPPVTRSSAQGL